jgi:uncharacterized membrane protein YadS
LGQPFHVGFYGLSWSRSIIVLSQPIIEAEPHEVAAGIATVVLCGTSAMFIYPQLQLSVSSSSAPIASLVRLAPF